MWQMNLNFPSNNTAIKNWTKTGKISKKGKWSMYMGNRQDKVVKGEKDQANKLISDLSDLHKSLLKATEHL